MVKVRAGTVEPVFGNLINYYGLRKINTIGGQQCSALLSQNVGNWCTSRILRD